MPKEAKVYKHIKQLSSAALRLGCSHFGANPNHAGKQNELVFIFGDVHYCAYVSWLLAHGYTCRTAIRQGNYLVYVRLALLNVSQKRLYKNFAQFCALLPLTTSFGYCTNWAVQEVAQRERAKHAESLCATQWGKKNWYELNLLSSI